MDETGGDASIADGGTTAEGRDDDGGDGSTRDDDDDDGGAKECGPAADGKSTAVFASADMFVHAKYPERIASGWLR